MTRSKKRGIGAALAFVLLAWLGFLGFIGWAMRQPPEDFGHVMAHMPGPAYMLFPFETMWTSARRGHLHVGSQAPDFTVQTLDTKAPVQLASLWGNRPVVLIFGSYT